MNFKALLDSISSCDINDNLEEQFISLYKIYGLKLDSVPHKLRKQGFFYEECRRVGRFDLIPQLKGDEILSCKTKFELENNSLNRVDAKALKLKKVKADIHFLRAYTYQVLNSYFGFTERCSEIFDGINKPVEELTIEEILSIVPIDSNFDEDTITSDFYFFVFDNNSISKYNYKEYSIDYFDNDHNKEKTILIETPSYAEFPELFTAVEQVSFDQGGLVKLQRYGMQIYGLYSFDGNHITGPCHDLDLMVNGKYVERDSGNRPGFHVSQYRYLSKSSEYIESFGDFSGDYLELLYVEDRDKIAFDKEGYPYDRIENFNTPKNREEAKSILSNESTNWVTSPELVEYYKNDKELAKIAIDREALVFTVLDYELRQDIELQQKVCDYLFVREYNISLEELLTSDEIKVRVLNDGRLLKYLSNNYSGNKHFILQIIPESLENSWDDLGWIKFLSKEILNDREVALKVVSCKGTSIEWFSDSIKNDIDVVITAIKQDGTALREVSNELKGNKDIALQAVSIDGSTLSYVSEELKNDFDVVLAAIKNSGSALRYASEEFRSHREMVMIAVGNEGTALSSASEELKNDFDVVLKAVQTSGAALEYASDSLKNNNQIVKVAVENANWALRFASEELQNDPEFQTVKQKNDVNDDLPF